MSDQIQELEERESVATGAESNPPVGKILVVDDEPELRSILVESLRKQGYQVTGCGSGSEALAKLRERDFDLLLTDLMMPEMDGIALLKAALKVDPHLVGIIVTGQGTIQTAVDAMQIGAFDYVLKPFRMQTLMPVLTRAMNVRHLKLENVQLRETVAIHSLCQTISFTLDPQTVLSKLADAALQQSDADEVSILLPTNDGTELYVAAVRGERRERLLGERVPLQETISSWVARERTPLILNGEVRDERFVALWPRPEIRSAVSVPMQVANKLVGIINLNMTNRLRPFTLGQMKALTILASTAAAALESASLYTQVQQAEKNYRSIFENAVEGIFQSTLDGRFITANPAMARILGYESPEELITTATNIARQVYVHPEARTQSTRLQKEFGLLHGFEFEAYRKNGDRIWLSLNRRSVRDEKGAELYHEGTIEDITENKRAEERVRQSEKQLAEAQHLALVGSWNRDLKNNVLTWSDELYYILGLEQEKFDPNFDAVVDSCIVPDDRELVSVAVNRSLQTHDPFSIEYRVLRPDGQMRTIHARGYVLVDDQGNPVRMFGTAQDVTERVQAEEEQARLHAELREQTERVTTIVATVPGVVFEVWGRPDSAENKADFVSEYIEPMLGYTVSEWLSTPDFWLTIVHPDDRERVAQEAAANFAARRKGELEFRWIGKDKRVLWVRSHSITICDQEGNPVGVRGVVMDITKRVAAEQALRDSEERYRLLFASNPLPMWVYDVETMAFLEVNDSAIFHYGYSREEFLSMTILDIRSPDTAPALLENIANLGEGLDNAGIWKHLKKDGSTIQVEITSHVLNFAGRHAELVLANDVTERRHSEEMRMRRTAQVALRADISSALAESNIPLRTILDRCAQAMVQHLGAAFARIWTLNKKDDVLELQASAGIYTHIDGPHARVPVGMFKIGLIAQEREPHITNSVQTDPRVSDKEWAKRNGMVAFAGYPLIVEDRMVGVMAMFARQYLADDTLDALASVADIISQGIERKRAEHELSNSEERYRDLVENAHDLIYEHDLNGNFTATNHAGERITGYSLEESLKLNLKQTVAPEYLEKAQAMLRQKLAGEKATAYELELIAKDGHHFMVEVNTRLVLKDGVPVGVQGIARDITERRLAEEALRESEARNRAILESSMDCIITMDQDGRVVDWNPAAETTFGYSQEETIGKGMAELIIPQRFRERHTQGLARYLATGEGRVLGKRLELNAERRDGTEFPIELTITRIQSQGTLMFTGYLRDITERKKAEGQLAAQYAVTNALAESNTINEGAAKILQAICESLGWEYGALWTVDRDATVLRCSQIWQAPGSEVTEFASVSRQSVFASGIGLPGRVWRESQPVWLADVVEDPDFPRFATAARVGLHGGCAFPIRLRSEILGVVEFFTRSIRESDPELLAMMVTVGSQIGQFMERKRVENALAESEQQLRQSQKLEAIGQLAGGVAHDFNNLLTAINGYSALALRRLGNEHPISSYLEEIKKAGDRAANLTRQLLAFGRKQLLQPLALNVNDIVSDMIKLLKRLIGEDIQLITRPGANLKQIKADPGQLEQVLVNLVVNARDAMPTGGMITIETANTTLDGIYASKHLGVSAGEYVMLAISDTGTGMDQETLSRIFEPFFTTKEKGKGTGLGLSTVYGIIRQSGGNIWVYSEVGKGTTFKVYLPLVDERPATQGEALITPAIKRGTETVMLVEDEDMVRKLASELLVDAGYIVLEANGGEEAIKLCKQHTGPIDLLITDVVMPKMSGKQVAEQLLALHPEMKVLFMSGYTDEAIVHHGVVDSDIAFIQKPFSERALAHKIREVLDSENGHN